MAYPPHSNMKPCSNPPAILFCMTGPGEKRAVKAKEADKLGDPHSNILNIDLAKAQLKNKSQGAYILLFKSRDAAETFFATHGSASGGQISSATVKVDTSKLKGVTLYSVSDIETLLGFPVTTPMPDYLAHGTILKEALR